MRHVTRLQFEAPPVKANIVTAEAPLPQDMVVLSVHQWRGKIVVFVDAPVKPLLVPTTVGFFSTEAGPVPHPSLYAGSVIMLDSQKEWHVYFGITKNEPSNEGVPDVPAKTSILVQ